MSKYSDYKEWYDEFTLDDSEEAIEESMKSLGCIEEMENDSATGDVNMDDEYFQQAIAAMFYADHRTQELQNVITALNEEIKELKNRDNTITK